MKSRSRITILLLCCILLLSSNVMAKSKEEIEHKPHYERILIETTYEPTQRAVIVCPVHDDHHIYGWKIYSTTPWTFVKGEIHNNPWHLCNLYHRLEYEREECDCGKVGPGRAVYDAYKHVPVA